MAVYIRVHVKGYVWGLGSSLVVMLRAIYGYTAHFQLVQCKGSTQGINKEFKSLIDHTSNAAGDNG